MAIIKKATPGDIAAKRLQLIYAKAEQNIINEITRKRNLALVDYADVTALKRVQEILRNMVDESGTYIPIAIKDPFYKASDFVSAPYGYYNAQALTSAQTVIVERLIENLLIDVEEAADWAYRSAEEYLAVGRLEAGELRNLSLELTAQREAEGRGWQTIQNKMAAQLTASGITSFVDKAGRHWSLSSYCAMATRTTGRQAQVAAALTADDWDLWQISKIGSTCPLCSVYEGRVYSKSGTDPDYPPLAMAFGKIDTAGGDDLSNTWLNIHPNCLHALVRYTTAGKTDEQIQHDKDFSSFTKRPANVDYRSKKQIAAYRDKEKARAAFRSDMKQFKKYQAALGNEMPKTFETFMKHKKLDDEIYKGWEEKFRSLSSKAENLEKALESGIINMPIGLTRSKRRDSAEPMPRKQLNKIVKAFKRQGGRIIMDAEAQKILEQQEASGITLNEKTILLRKRPSRADVFEELIHATQFRNGEIKDGSLDTIIGEIKAKEKLLKYSKSYKLTDKEIRDTEKQLENYKEQLKNFRR